MKAPDFYLNNYIADELRAAFDKEDVCTVSYTHLTLPTNSRV